jgi:hypothetical protein
VHIAFKKMEGVVNWFRKDREKVKEGKEIWNELKRQIWKNQHKGRRNDVGSFASIIAESLKELDDLKNFPSDPRLPICSLYHHLVNTAGVAACFAIDNGYDRAMRDKIRVAALLHDIGKLTELGNGGAHVEELLSRIDWLEDADKQSIKKFAEMNEVAELISKADTVASASDKRYEVEWVDGGVKSKDAIFPHILKFKTGEPVVLGRKEEKPVGDVEWWGEEMPFHDEIVGGGVVVDGYPELESEIGLLALDIRGIQGYIKEAEKLNALRGGSAIVDETLKVAKEVISEEVAPEAILFARGGNLVSFLPVNKEVQQRVKERMQKEIDTVARGGLKVAIATQDYAVDDIAKCFNTVLKDIFQKVESKKSKPEYGKVVEPERSGEVCRYCFNRKAALKDKEGTQICNVCAEKIKEGMEERWKSAYKYTTVLAEKLTPRLAFSRQLADIGNTIAVLSIDGNMMGRMFVQTMTPAEYRFKSEIFDREFKQALKETINDYSMTHTNLVVHEKEVESLGKVQFLGLDVLYVGGDDVLIIMNAKGALGFANELVKQVADRFRFESNLFSTPTVTISVGIAIADSKFPIYFLIEKAEEALESAKMAFRMGVERNNRDFFERPDGAIAFASVSGAMPSEENHTFVLDKDREAVDKIVDYVERVNLKGYPRSLVSLLINCGESEEEKLNLIKHLYSRLSEKDLFDSASAALGEKNTALELCEELCEIISKRESVREGLKAIVPMVWSDVT